MMRLRGCWRCGVKYRGGVRRILSLCSYRYSLIQHGQRVELQAERGPLGAIEAHLGALRGQGHEAWRNRQAGSPARHTERREPGEEHPGLSARVGAPGTRTRHLGPRDRPAIRLLQSTAWMHQVPQRSHLCFSSWRSSSPCPSRAPTSPSALGGLPACRFSTCHGVAKCILFVFKTPGRPCFHGVRYKYHLS